MAQEGLDALVTCGNSGVNRHDQADNHYISRFLGNRGNYALITARAAPVIFVQSFNHVPDARESAMIMQTANDAVSDVLRSADAPTLRALKVSSLCRIRCMRGRGPLRSIAPASRRTQQHASDILTFDADQAAVLSNTA